MDDSLQQLLEDAKRMQQENMTNKDNGEGGNVKTTIRNALSTLVTADFFVVCGFLLWFLVGIFCSSVLKDDTIQIAFNSKWNPYLAGRTCRALVCVCVHVLGESVHMIQHGIRDPRRSDH
jgi:hypothetical protein